MRHFCRRRTEQTSRDLRIVVRSPLRYPVELLCDNPLPWGFVRPNGGSPRSRGSSSVNATLVGAHMCTPENPRPELRLLREIYRSSLGLPFSAAGIIDRAQINLEQNDDSRLHDVIFETIGELSSRKLGNLLADIAGEAIGDYVVHRVGRKRKPRVGQLWRIEKKRSELTKVASTVCLWEGYE